MFKDETGETVPAIVSEELWDKANEVRRDTEADAEAFISEHMEMYRSLENESSIQKSIEEFKNRVDLAVKKKSKLLEFHVTGM